MKPTPQERAAAIGEKARSQPPVDERRLGAMLDRSIKRECYLIDRPGGELIVIFNPPQTIGDVCAMYPGCKVTPA